jgi:hypothetical protein
MEMTCPNCGRIAVEVLSDMTTRTYVHGTDDQCTVSRRGVRWSEYAGGTTAPAGKKSYVGFCDRGEYHISPVCTVVGHWVGYRVQFFNQTTASWQPIGLAAYSTVRAAKATAHRHYNSLTKGD